MPGASPRPRTVRVVEVIGPAGAGKSTLAQRLAAGDGGTADRLALWGLPSRLLLAHAIRLVPTWLAAWREGQPLAWAELTQMVRLGALHAAVTGRAARGNGLVVLDEGPVFGLSWFQVFFPSRDTSGAFTRWRAALLARWAEVVDAIVVLEAPDPVLARRIRTRAKPHMVKDRPDAEIRRFSARFRAAFHSVLAEMTRGDGPAVVRHRVRGDEPPEAVAGAVLESLEGLSDES